MHGKGNARARAGGHLDLTSQEAHRHTGVPSAEQAHRRPLLLSRHEATHHLPGCPHGAQHPAPFPGTQAPRRPAPASLLRPAPELCALYRPGLPGLGDLAHSRPHLLKPDARLRAAPRQVSLAALPTPPPSQAQPFCRGRAGGALLPVGLAVTATKPLSPPGASTDTCSPLGLWLGPPLSASPSYLGAP